MKNMTPEELLRDYISFHYVEGNITDEQRIKMEFAAANYLKELKALSITAVVQPKAEKVCDHDLYRKSRWYIACNKCTYEILG